MSEAKFLEGNLMRHVSVMAFTGSIGLMAIFVVDFVDMIFISMLGNAALAAALGYAGTILFFTTSFSIGLSIAAGALVSRAIGADEEEEAREYATSVIMLGVMLAVIVVALIWVWQRAILGALGAEGEVLDLASSYLSIILPSMPILMFGMVGGAVLRAHGDARRAMYATLGGGIVNAVFDPIFIFGFGWGLEGAAYASVLARIAVAVISLWPAIKTYDGLAMPGIGILIRDTRAVVAIAFPAVLANVATPVGSAIITREMSAYGPDAVAGMAIIGRLTPVAFAVVFALSGAIGPIVGQNAGAGNGDRVRGAMMAALQFVTAYVVLVAAILFVAQGWIADIFKAEGVTLSLIALFCGPLALTWIFNGWIFVGNAAFNNLKHPFYSTWINWGRHTIGTWPLAVAGGAMFGAGGVLIGQAVGGAIFAAISIWLAFRVMDEQGSGHHAGDFVEASREHVVASRRH